MKSSLPQKRIFISYRRQDTAGETGRLVDSLRTRFTNDQLFLDIDNLEPGTDYTSDIENYLDSCDVFLAVIGPRWLGEQPSGPRIKEANDWVRMELATALRRGIRVVPVLVDGGQLPKAEELPEDLQGLLLRQTIEISNKRWAYDTDQLIDFLITKIGIIPKPAAAVGATSAMQPKRKIWPYVLGGFVLCFVLLVVAGFLMDDEKSATKPAAQAHEAIGTPADSLRPQAVNVTEATDVSGSWLQDDGVEKRTFVLTQQGSVLDVTLQVDGADAGTGSGEINGQNVELTVPINNVATGIQLTLANDATELTGHYTVQGVQKEIRLVRSQN